jgi:Flp pilus assembly pilin Flp
METNFPQLLNYVKRRIERSEGGQTMAEYGILIAVIALVVVLAAITLGSSISSLFGSASGSL